MYYFYKMHIYWKIIWLKILWREFKWDICDAKKYDCKPNINFIKRMISYSWMVS